MSEEENSQKKAQSVIVDFYVIFKKFQSVSAAGLVASGAILVSIYFLMAYDPFGENELRVGAKVFLDDPHHTHVSESKDEGLRTF